MTKRALSISLTAIALLLFAAPVAAQSDPVAPANCGIYQGVACSGWFSDNAGVVDDDELVETSIAALVGQYGNEIAVVTVTESPSGSPLEFANALGNEWGVGDAQRQDGIVVLVDVNNRRTEMTAGPGVPQLDSTRVTGAGNSFFKRGDFDSGIIAIVGSLEQELAFAGGDEGLGGSSTNPGVNLTPSQEEPSGGLVAGALAAAALIGGGVGLVAARQRRRERIGRQRSALVDDDVSSLDPSGHELPLLEEYSLVFRGQEPEVTTRDSLAALERIDVGIEPQHQEATAALWSAGLVAIVDRDRLVAETEVPLALRISEEQPILEGALQAAIASAADSEDDSDDQFAVKRQELQRIIASLRPHRVANTRFRIGQSIADKLVRTALGYALTTDDGARFLEAGPALDATKTLEASAAELDLVYATATTKATKMENLYEKLPASTTRPAVAAALADISDDVDSSYARYEALRQTLDAQGSMLSRDGLSIPAIAALLLMNNDAEDVNEFIAAYEANRGRGVEADTAVEYALAGLTHPGEIERVRLEADRLGLPVSLTAALLRRRDDGADVYRDLADQLAKVTSTTETSRAIATRRPDKLNENRRTIAAVLAISLEPAQAVRRWIEAREALAALGLVGVPEPVVVTVIV